MAAAVGRPVGGASSAPLGLRGDAGQKDVSGVTGIRQRGQTGHVVRVALVVGRRSPPPRGGLPEVREENSSY